MLQKCVSEQRQSHARVLVRLHTTLLGFSSALTLRSQLPIAVPERVRTSYPDGYATASVDSIRTRKERSTGPLILNAAHATSFKLAVTSSALLVPKVQSIRCEHRLFDCRDQIHHVDSEDCCADLYLVCVPTE